VLVVPFEYRAYIASTDEISLASSGSWCEGFSLPNPERRHRGPALQCRVAWVARGLTMWHAMCDVSDKLIRSR
jgi:hypothetical protein